MYHNDLYLQANKAQVERDIASLHRELAAKRAARAERPQRQPVVQRAGRLGAVAHLLRSLAGLRISRA